MFFLKRIRYWLRDWSLRHRLRRSSRKIEVLRKAPIGDDEYREAAISREINKQGNDLERYVDGP